MRYLATKIVLGILLMASQVKAQGPSVVTMCFRWQPDFTDRSGDDLTTNDPIRAYGVRAKVTSGRATWFDGYTSSATGCVTLGLDTRREYAVDMWADAQVVASGQIVKYRSAQNRVHALRVDSDFTPARGSDSITYTWGPGSSAEASSVMPAAAHTVRNARGTGLGPGTWVLVSQNCPGGRSACYSANTGIAYVGDNGGGRFTVAHELGHHLVNLYGHSVPDKDYGMTSGYDGRCPSSAESHSAESLEHQSAAANEAIASFVSAIAFNDETESDCTEDAVNCEGTYDTSAQLERHNSHRYAENFCMGLRLNPFVPAPGAGNESDWLRTFWDLTTDGNVPYTRIYELMSSLRDMGRAGTYWAARERAEEMGIVGFRQIAEFNGIDW